LAILPLIPPQKTPLRLLLLSTPVGPLGSGLGGGVEASVVNLARVLGQRGHRITIVAPLGSVLPDHSQVELVQMVGSFQPTAQTQPRLQPSEPFPVANSALANACEYVQAEQARYDLIVNFAYDWQPFQLTAMLETPLAHFVTMGSLLDVMDQVIAQTALQFPNRLGAYTRSQAETFRQTSLSDWQILGSAIDLQQYDYCDEPEGSLGWVGRISPEKGLEDAIAASASARRPLKIFGKIEDAAYWQSLTKQINEAPAPVNYCGFLSTPELQKALGSTQALLMTPKWIEAFGMVAIEAMACGVPVIAYRRGGPAEIVRDGQTGWLVQPDNIEALVSAIARIGEIDRRQCRQDAADLYSLTAWGDRFERWFYQIVSGMMSS